MGFKLSQSSLFAKDRCKNLGQLLPNSFRDIIQLQCAIFFFFFKVFGGHMSFFGATGTPVLDFW